MTVDASKLAVTRNTYVVTLTKHRATWYWFCANPQGGGFGSNHCGSKAAALSQALRGIPSGPYVLFTNGKERQGRIS